MNARLRISPRTMSRIGRWFTVTGYWLRGAAPMAAAVFAALFLFQDAIFDSILSTPNPALVYMIFCVLAVGAIFTLGVLGSFIRIESIALRWHAESDNAGFRAKVMNNVHVGLLRPILALLTGERALTGRMRQVAIENELKVIEKRLSDRLNLPNWIAGALVGLGLVGTFVGLLGTLEDLGKLFASLGTSGAPGTDAGVMFGDMVRRLQAPMRGMGTAFVASLYGLLGSLLLGLMVLSVRKTGSLVIDRLRWLVREESFGNEGEVQSAEPAPRLGQPSGMSPDHWADMIEAMRSQHAAVVIQTGTMNEEISRIGQMLQTQQQAISAESSAVHDEVTRLGEMLQFQQEAVAADSASARKEVARISEMMRAMTLAMHERTQVDLQIQSLMDSGVHWADSWSQINEQLISWRRPSLEKLTLGVLLSMS